MQLLQFVLSISGIIIGISIDDYVGIWKRVQSGSDHACHKINETNLECKSGKIRPQILGINNSTITWEIDDNNGNLTVLNGDYIGRDLIQIENSFWVKKGTSSFKSIDE